jgi:hypothetical protein
MTTHALFAARVRAWLASHSFSSSPISWLLVLSLGCAAAWYGTRGYAQEAARQEQLNGFVQQAQLTANNGETSDHLGQAVALSGDTILVGAPGDNVGVQSNQGSAYVYRRVSGVWSQEAQLFAPDGVGGDGFGNAVGLSGDVAVVAAAFDDRAAGFNAGSVYVFRRSGATWNFEQQLTPSDPADNDRFGVSVAVSGDTILVGAPMKATSRGAAYVFRFASGAWTQEAPLLASGGVANDEFGAGVALHGDVAVIGAAGKDGKGAAYGFTRSGVTWAQQPVITHASLEAGDRFGESVALYNGTALIGAPKGLSSNQGAAYAFTFSAGVWNFQAQLLASDGATDDEFGKAVALYGDTALVGAPLDDVGTAPIVVNQGSAYVFTRAGVTWSQQERLIILNGSTDDQAGLAVALDSQAAVLGVWLRDITVGAATNSDQGAAYVFNVGCPNITINPVTLPPGLPNVAYSQTLTASGGAMPYSFTITAGALPDGFTLSTAGVLSGTTSQMGSFSFTVRATDANGCFAERSYTLAIGACPTITFNPAVLATAPINAYYVQPLIAQGGASPYFFNVVAGALPPGLTLAGTGVITGTPTAYGTYKFTVIATDSTGCSATRNYSLTITCPVITLTPAFLPGASLNVPYQQTLTAQGGAAPYSYSYVGDLPPGMTLLNTGVLSGAATALGTFNFAVIAVDVNGCTVVYPYSLRVCRVLTLAPGSLVNGIPNQLYPTVTFQATGGLAPYSYTLTGVLPQGMSFNQGVLSGAPMQAGTYNFIVQATDAEGCVVAQSYTWIVAADPCAAGGCGTLTATPNPVVVCDGSGLGVTTMSWNAPTITQTQVRVGSPNGALFAAGGSTGSATTGKWVFNGAQFFLLNATNGTVLASATIGVTSNGCGMLTAAPNPIQVCDNSGLGVTTLSWNAPNFTQTQLRIGSPSGALFAAGGAAGSATTGKWVSNGMQFFLVNAANGATLASTTVNVTTAGCATGTLVATPAQVQVCDGSGLGVTTLRWNTSGVTSTQLRVGSPSGAIFTSGGATGMATTGKWVSNGLQFFLVNAANGATLASVTVGTTTAGCSGLAGVITATPTAIQVCDGSGLGVTTINWNAPGNATTQVRIGSPNGVLFTSGSASGSATTGKWVSHGLTFFLVNAGTNATLGSVTVSVNASGCLAP